MRTEELSAVLESLSGPRFGDGRPPVMENALNQWSDFARLLPHERNTLLSICQAVDKQSDPAAAWRMLENLDETCRQITPVELNALHSAVIANIGRCTVAYLNMDTGKSASGMLVNISGRLFLATTAHSVPQNPAGKIMVIRYHPDLVTENRPQILSSNRSDNGDDLDVAYLEFAPEFLSRLPQCESIPLSRIDPCGVGHPDHVTILAGYPGELVRKQTLSQNSGVIQFVQQSWLFPGVLMPEYWHQVPASDRPHNPDMDVMLCYDRDSEVTLDGQWTNDQLPEPFGLSGGGLWQRTPAADCKIWSPDQYNLIGIQSEWPGFGKYLRATQVQHWLRLIGHDHTELRDTLSKAFPLIDFTR